MNQPSFKSFISAIAILSIFGLSGCDRKDAANAIPESASSSSSASSTPTNTPAQAALEPVPSDSSSLPAATNPENTSPNLPATTSAGASNLNAADRNFILQTAEGGAYEVGIAGIANERARRPEVRSFAAMLVEAHTDSNKELKSLAAARNIDLPSEIPQEKQKLMDKFSSLPTAKFDQEFIQTVGLKDHQENIKRFEKISKETNDAELKAWVEKTLPVLKQHYKEAEKLAQQN